MKPREFEIYFNGPVGMVTQKGEYVEEYVNVIEKSAYHELQRQLAIATEALELASNNLEHLDTERTEDRKLLRAVIEVIDDALKALGEIESEGEK